MARKNKHLEALKKHAFAMPGAWEDHPWGESVAKVKKKVFAFFGVPRDDGFGLSVKLPRSQEGALLLPFTEPTGYGLGKSGWVSATFSRDDEPPVALLRDWIEESYRAVAPKTLIAELDGAPPKKKAAAKKKKVAKKKTAKKKTATRKTKKK